MYDVIVIGAGPAGYEAAIQLGMAGKSVCIIEKQEEQMGGTCLNEGCVPAKNFLETAAYVKKSAYFQSCGVSLDIKGFDIEQLKNNTQTLVGDLKQGIFTKLKKANVEIKYGTASFVDKTTVQVDDEVISAKDIVIASGSSHRNHPLLNLQENFILSSKEVFDLKEIPKSILIVGGGAIGCEFATFFDALGCEVEIAEFTAKLVPIEDDDISKALKRELERKGIKVYLKANVTSCKVNNNDVEVTIDLGRKEEIKTYDKVLVSIGRVPNTSSLNLQNAIVEEDNGFVEVDENLCSITNKNVYAIGDVIKTPALAHVAYYEAKRVAQIILAQDESSTQEAHEILPQKAIFPSVTFCSPQVASIGESERVLKEQGVDFRVKKLFFKLSGKAKIKGDDSGFVKIIHESDSGIILGAAIIGNDATELIHEFLIAINANLTIKDLSQMIFAHPTLSESILDALH